VILAVAGQVLHATLLGLRDSPFSFDIERNARGAVLGMLDGSGGDGTVISKA